MVDVIKKKPLQVSTDGTAGPYLMLPLDDVGRVKGLLDSHGIGHSVEEDAISLDGSPYIAVIDFGLEADADRIQSIFDSVQ